MSKRTQPTQGSITRKNSLSVGELLISYLEEQNVSVVFGIPGVHTVEMYRGLGNSPIKHVTPRHEQGAGFMADGYSRASGKLGVAFVITGPGITNILTPMGQALADSIPMLVISSVNKSTTLGKGQGHLHEMPDQHALCATVALESHHVSSGEMLVPALNSVFDDLNTKRPGPYHIQVPMDVFGQTIEHTTAKRVESISPAIPSEHLTKAIAKLSTSKRPVIVIGGGSQAASESIVALAEMLNAPVVQTINARGQMYGHSLCVPASPSLETIKTFLTEADTVLAIGTQFGPTDFDMYDTGSTLDFEYLIRVDIDADQLKRHPADIELCGRSQDIAFALAEGIQSSSTDQSWGADKAAAIREKARSELSPEYEHMVQMVEAIRDALPGSVIVGDSTQPVYAANMYYEHDSIGGWFNSPTGFGTLGYAIPAAIGAALGSPERSVVCIIGDGGAQFTLPELMTAFDEKLPITFLIWNNFGYQEIVSSMSDADVTVVGCNPTPPNFEAIAAANYIPYLSCANVPSALSAAMRMDPSQEGPRIVEIQVG